MGEMVVVEAVVEAVVGEAAAGGAAGGVAGGDGAAVLSLSLRRTAPDGLDSPASLKEIDFFVRREGEDVSSLTAW